MFDLTAPRQLGVGYDSGDVLLFRVNTPLTRRVRVSFLLVGVVSYLCRNPCHSADISYRRMTQNQKLARLIAIKSSGYVFIW